MAATNVTTPRPTTPAVIPHEAAHAVAKNEAAKVTTAPAKAPVAAKEADAATKAQSEKNQQATKSGANPAANPQLSKIEKEQVGLVVKAFNAAYEGAEKGHEANALAGNELAEYLGRNEKLAGPTLKQLNDGAKKPDWGALVRDTPEPAKTFIADKAWPCLSDEQKKGVVAGLIGSGAAQTAAHMIMVDLNAGRKPGSLVLEAARSGLPLPALLDAAGPHAVSDKLGDFMVAEIAGAPGVKEMFAQYNTPNSAFRNACDGAKIGPDDLTRLARGVVTEKVSTFFKHLEAHPSAQGQAAGAILLRGEAGGAAALRKIDLEMAEQAYTPEAKAALEADAAKRDVTINADLPVAEKMEKMSAHRSGQPTVANMEHMVVSVNEKQLELKVFSEAVHQGDLSGMNQAAAAAEKKGGAEAQKFAHDAAAVLAKGQQGKWVTQIEPAAMRERIIGEFRVNVDLPKSVTMAQLAGATATFALVAGSEGPLFKVAYRARMHGDAKLVSELRSLANMPDGPSSELKLSADEVAQAKAGAVALLRIADFTGPGNMPSVDFGTALAAKNDNEMSKIATHAAGLDETNQKIFARDAVKILIAKRLRDMPRAILEIDMPDTMKQRMFGEWNAQNPAVSAT